MVPEFGELPDLMEGENFSAGEVVALAPFIDPFFRPEEQHGRSGEDQVIVPAGKGQGKVDE